MRVVVSSGGPPVPVPKVAGEPGPAAVAAVRKAHLTPKVERVYSLTVPPGKSVGTAPASGTVRYGGTLVVDLSRGPAPVTVPTFGKDTTWAAAASALHGLQLVPHEVLAYSTSVPAGDVMALSPAGGTADVPVASAVTVTVSRGPRLMAVPDVAGLTIAHAVARLQAAGLQVTEQVGPPFATKATTTSPAPGTQVQPSSSVTLYVA